MPKLDKNGLKERGRILRDFIPKDQRELEIINALAQFVADSKQKIKNKEIN